jgi:hypothetical protein
VFKKDKNKMSKINQLMERQMTRKQFLVTLGMGIVGLFGFSSLMGIFSQNNPNPDNKLVDYGMRNYGP